MILQDNLKFFENGPDKNLQILPYLTAENSRTEFCNFCLDQFTKLFSYKKWTLGQRFIYESVCTYEDTEIGDSHHNVIPNFDLRIVFKTLVIISGGNNSCFGPIFSEESPSESVYPSFYPACNKRMLWSID